MPETRFDPTTGKSTFVNPATGQDLSMTSPLGEQVKAPTTGTTSPMVVTPDAAKQDLTKIQGTLNQAQQQMAQQAQAKTTAQTGTTQQPSVYKNPATGENVYIQDPQINWQDIKSRGLQFVSGVDVTGTSQGGQPQIYSYKDNVGNLSYYDAQGNQVNQSQISGKTITPLNFQPTTTTGMSVEQQKALSSLQTGIADVSGKIDSAISSAQSDLDKLRTGTFPLTPSQQAQLDATKQLADQLRTQQLTANQNYEAAIKQAGIVSGRSMYAPDVEAGNIQAAINSGLQKINALDAQTSQTLSQMEQGFREGNYKLVSEANKNYQDLLTKKQTELQTLYDKTESALKDARDYNYKSTQDIIQNTFKSEELTYKQKQDAIQNALEQGKFDETKRANLVKEAQAQEALDVQNKIAKLLQGTGKTVTTMTNGQPNPASQQEYLNQYSPDVQSKIKALADYSGNIADYPTTLRKGVAGFTRQDMISLVKGYDPTWDEKEYAARQKFLNGWKAGGQNSVIVAANTAIQHLAELKNQADNLGNLKVGTIGPLSTTYNSLQAYLADKSGGPNVARFKQTAVALAGEMAKIYKNSINSAAAPTDDEIKQQLDIMSTGMSPEQYNAIIENGITLMKDRLTSSVENYQINMGKAPDSILSPSARQKIEELKNKGINIDTSSLDYNPYNNATNEELMNSMGSSKGTAQNNADILNSWMSTLTGQTQ